MENSILTSTKKILGVAEDYTAFDLDIITHINTAFATLYDLGVGPVLGFAIEDASKTWTELGLPVNQTSMVRTYVYLKARTLFDPPTTSFLGDAMDKQIAELEWRLSVNREMLLHPHPNEEVVS